MDNRMNILDIWVDCVNMQQALSQVESFVVKGNRPYIVLASNPEKNFSVPKDPLLYETFRHADLLIPDGIGVVEAAKILYGVKLSRVPGVELMQNICAMAAKQGYRIFVFGASEEVSRMACEKLQRLYTGLNIVGRVNGFLGNNEMPTLVRDINDSKAQILFLALGSPKQEKWLSDHVAELTTVRVCQGIGGTLDTIAGTVRRAPQLWRRLNLEWLYRLLAEPKRIMRQKLLPIFAARVLATKFRTAF